MRVIETLIPGNIYHIYNRGINGTNIFMEKRNYYYFLAKYCQYCSTILETYAYALLQNHFHLLVKINENVPGKKTTGAKVIELNASRQLSHFFNSYAQSFNKAYKRHGTLFEQPFRRKHVDNDTYYTSLIYYIHLNPQRHQFVDDFRDWEFTSWHTIIHNKSSFIAKDRVIHWFGTIENFKNVHLTKASYFDYNRFQIE